jgi:hypothetical protein
MADHADANRMAAFIEGRAAAAERAAIVVHLAACEDCRARLAAYARGARPARSAAAVLLPLAATVIIAAGAGFLVINSRLPLDSSPASTPQAPASADPRPPDTVPVPTAPADTATSPAPDVWTRRGGERQVSGKTFRLVAGEWIDADYDPLKLLPVENAIGADLTRATVARIPALEPFLVLRPRVLVVHGDTVYRLGQ